MGVRTKDWGPWAWKLLHAISKAYDVHQTKHTQQIMLTWLDTTARIFPCIYCRRSVSKFRRSKDTRFQYVLNTQGAFVLSYRLHHRVNQKLYQQDVEAKRDLSKWKHYEPTVAKALEQAQDIHSDNFVETFFWFANYMACDIKGKHRIYYLKRWLCQSAALFKLCQVSWANMLPTQTVRLQQLHQVIRETEIKVYNQLHKTCPPDRLPICEESIVRC